MQKLKKYNDFTPINETITLTEDEKRYLWSKIEFNKKKKHKENNDELYTTLNSEGESEISKDDMIEFLNDLEYSTKKQMKDPDKKFRNDTASSLKGKIPNDWIGVRYSSIDSKRRKE